MTAKIPTPKLSKVKRVAEALDPTKAKSTWDKVLAYTPVVVTVLATLLAGLSNSELNAAQYERAWAAQLQSKIADQWNFFQVKRIRGSALDNTLEVLQNVSRPVALEPGEFRAQIAALATLAKGGVSSAEGDEGKAERAGSLIAAVERLVQAVNSPTAEQALAGIAAGAGPSFVPEPIQNEAIRSAIAAVESRKSEDEIAVMVRAVGPESLGEAIRTAEANTVAFDAAIAPGNRALEAIRAAVAQAAGAARALERAQAGEWARGVAGRLDQISADFTAARLRYVSRRYDQEALLNKDLAQLTEIKVRQSNLVADHHKRRSQLFFFGMIIAQAAVIAATMALAVRQKSLLWGLATGAGLVAVSFALYVRFYV